MKMKQKQPNFIEDPTYEPVNPFRFDFEIPILRYVQVNETFLDGFN